MKKLLVFHILVEHKYEAEDYRKKIVDKKSFESIAAKFSKCSSSQQGGLLGEFNPKKFVETFTEAVESLKPGEISSPVRTQFGYHIIMTQLV